MDNEKCHSTQQWKQCTLANCCAFQAYSGVKGVNSRGEAINHSIENEQATQMDNDSLAILNGTRVLVPGEEGLRDIRVVEAIQWSVRVRRRVVI
ncbi:MAG: hypothetical protein IPM82_31950 [Saprospiraceae bacterium]|nr:hypothetical protein [Saprospiraceae bacterium]